MNVLGINFGHDSAACLIMDGNIINAIEEEKISRKKQNYGWPEKAIEIILSQNNLSPKDIDFISFGTHSYKMIGKNEIKHRFNKKISYKYLEIFDRIFSYFFHKNSRISSKNKFIFKDELIKKGFKNIPIEFYNHHLCHAISANFCAPFESDMIITADGHGDGHSFNFYIPQALNLKCIKSNDYTTSVGQFYSTITTLLGFRAGKHEGKITGLAAFGKKTDLIEKFNSLFKYEKDDITRYPFEDSTMLLKNSKKYKNLSLSKKINLNEAENKKGSLYAKNSLLLLEWLENSTKGSSKEDIAFACQKVSEEVILNEIDLVFKKNFDKDIINVSLAGGVFANVRINQKIYERPYVKNIFVQPAMGDSGLALGASIQTILKHDSDNYKRSKIIFKNSFHGPDFSSGLPQFINQYKTKYNIEEMKCPAKTIAKHIFNNKIIGFWNGRMEWGPRALGSRSILLNTFDKNINDTLNKRLNRTEFMPFAPAVIDYMAKTYFPKYNKNNPSADYMTITYDVDPKYHEELQAVVHVDGTSRPQIVRKETTPYYYDIINEFYKISGCGAIVNTSFNVHEEPIVSDAKYALNSLKNNRIDLLVLGKFLLSNKI
tara:strand:+ start:368 stop:2173 length:1806 start_codon:yes stop_codon:yes gene_type:complete